MLILTRRPRTQQPLGGVAINPALRSPTAVWYGAQWLRSSVLNETATPRGTNPPALVHSARGPAASFTNAASQLNRLEIAADATSVFPSTSQATIAVLYRHRDTTARNSTLFAYNSGGSGVDRVQAHAPYGDGNLYWDFANSTAGSGRVSVAFAKTTNWETLVFVAGGGKGREVWRNNQRIVSNTTATGARNAVTVPFCIGGYDGAFLDNDCDNVDVALFVVSSATWTDAEIIRWSIAPEAATFSPFITNIPLYATSTAPTISALSAINVTATSAQPRISYS